ncbi:MAG TPA: ParB/RepB/Spo0J family partition protein [Myxococcota bacterium]
MDVSTTSNKQSRGLGRGLSALIPPKPAADEPSPMRQGALHLPVETILPGDGQPRQKFDDVALAELAESIRSHGVIQPILVRKRPLTPNASPSEGQQYEIIAGERRWRAAQKAGLKSIPVVVSDAAPDDTLTLALVENLQREDLNAIEEAEAFHRLHEALGYTQQEIAEAVGKDRTTVANSLRLLKLPLPVRQQVLSGELTMGHARALLALDDPEEIEKLGREVVARKWSVRQTEKAAQPASPRARTKPNGKETEAERDVRQRVQRALGTRVELKQKAGKGQLTVHFASFAELESLLARFGA